MNEQETANVQSGCFSSKTKALKNTCVARISMRWYLPKNWKHNVILWWASTYIITNPGQRKKGRTRMRNAYLPSAVELISACKRQ